MEDESYTNKETCNKNIIGENDHIKIIGVHLDNQSNKKQHMNYRYGP